MSLKSQVTVTLDLSDVARWILGLLLMWAAVSKLANPTEFLGALYAYQLPLPRALLQIVAVVLPWFELFCGLLLLLNVWTESALLAGSALLVVFLAVTGQAWVRGLQISCGCFNLGIFGLDRSFPGLSSFLESPGFAFLRNLVLAGVSLVLLFQRLEETVATTPAPASPGGPRPATGKA